MIALAEIEQQLKPAQIIAISTETQRYTRMLREQTGAMFPVLTDMDGAYAMALNIAVWLDDKLACMISEAGWDVPLYQGGKEWVLPIPAVSNLLGTHLGGTATGNIWMTATLAIVTMVMMVVNGLRLGGKAYLAHFCPGPIWMAPLLVPVEIIGLIAKVFALAVRLFANMLAGHILLAVLLSFIMVAGAKSTGLGLGVGLLVVSGSVAINLLELFVAFLQAYVFTFLTALFMGMALNPSH